MDRGKGGSRKGAGRPKEGASHPRVDLCLGRDEDAAEVKREVARLHEELNWNGRLRDTVKLILEHFR